MEQDSLHAEVERDQSLPDFWVFHLFNFMQWPNLHISAWGGKRCLYNVNADQLTLNGFQLIGDFIIPGLKLKAFTWQQ